jgi:alpha-ketoglutarate-dependent taurine dioxygenase
MSSTDSIFTSLNDPADYLDWRKRKLSNYPTSAEDLIVKVKDPVRLNDQEYRAIGRLLDSCNMAIWGSESSQENAKYATLNIGRQFGMQELDHNMGADHDGVSELTVREGQWRAEYIPYSNKPLHWHTDGYYNTDDRKILGMVLYCVQDAARGGENALMDHEIAYIHLRDTNPDYIQALLHPEAMTIPANIVNGREIRPDRAGPVFSVLEDGALHMRYTARTRSIIWRDDALTKEAVDCLVEFLASDTPYIFRARLAPGQGLICNNVLHDRSGFDNDETHERKLFRLRYYDRATIS